MLKDGISDNKARSFNYILNYLSEKLLDSITIDSLKKLLIARNQVVHSGINLTKIEIEEMIKTADKIIDELEKQTKRR